MSRKKQPIVNAHQPLSQLSTDSQRTSVLLPKRIGITLFFLMFNLIYGPRVFGSNLFDIISLTAIFVTIIYLLHSGFKIKYIKGSEIFFFLLALLTVYSFIVSVANFPREFQYPIKYLRVAINFLAVYILCLCYDTYYRKLAVYKALEHVFWAVALHSFIMLAAYFSIDFHNVLIIVSGFDGAKSIPNRTTGLTISYNTLSIVQGFGLLVAIVMQQEFQSLWRRSRWKNSLTLPATFAIFASLFLAGRTAAYIMLIFCVLAALFFLRQLLSRRLLGLFSLLVIFAILWNSFIDAEVIDRFTTVTLALWSDPLNSILETQDLSGAKYTTKTLDYLATMYFLPENDLTMLFGSSLSGRGEIYIPSDVGFVLNIFAIGILGSALQAAIYIYFLLIAIEWLRYDSRIAYLALVLTVAIILVHLKEQTLLTRHAATLSAFLLFFYYITRHRVRHRAAEV